MRLLNLLFLLLLVGFISSCGAMIITGEAQNSVDGALINTSDGVYVDNDNMTWSDSLVGKQIEAKVKILRTVILTEADLVTEDGLHLAGRIGKTVYVEVIKYRLLELEYEGEVLEGVQEMQNE